MTPKEYFNQVFEIERAMNTTISERDTILQTVIGATPMQENATYSNQFNSTTENAVMKLLRYSEDSNQYLNELVRLHIKLSKEISQLEKYNHQMVLRERYLCSKKFEEIAVEQNYVYGSIIRFHGEALEAFKKKFPDKFK